MNSPRKSVQSYREILEELIIVESWLISIGINPSKSRFAQVKKNMSIISKQYDKNKIPELIKRKGRAWVIVSLMDSIPFLRIYHAFSSDKVDKILLEKIREAINGPFFPWDEKKNTNNDYSRNTLFELEIASMFKLRKFTISGFNDLSIKFEDLIFNIQCKRFWDSKSIKEHVKKAHNQIKVELDSCPSGRGIIALSVEKPLGLYRKLLQSQTIEKADEEIGKFLMDYAKQNRPKWNIVKIDTRMLAVLFYVRYVTAVGPKPGLYVGTKVHLDLFTIPHEQSPVQANDDYKIRLMIKQVSD